MSVGIGIVGLAKSGRTTIFNALTRGRANTGVYTPEAPHIGSARVQDPRLAALAVQAKPEKITPAEVRYLDIGTSVKSLVQDTGISGQLLNQLSNTDAIADVVRAFTDDSIPHIENSVDAARDIATMDLELAFSDLAIIERRLKRMETLFKKARPDERQHIHREQELLLRIKAALEQETPVRELSLTTDEAKAIATYQFLSAKPLLTIINIGEDQLPRAKALEEELSQRFARPGHRLITLCGKLEMELAQLDEETAEACRAEFCLDEPGLDKAIKASYDLLGLITFFTTGPDEVKAWSIQSGTIALKAAGKIHTDIERGFIRAEAISFGDLIKSGSLAEARKHGLLRLEGKSYIVQDGDVITFLFNV